MTRAFLRPTLVAVLIAGTGVRADGQRVLIPFASRPADPACQDRLNAALSLTPAVSRDTLSRVLARLDGCAPELGQGVAAVVRTLRSATDTAIAALAFIGAPSFTDAAIFTASRDVAADPSASELMRVWALRTLLSYAAPGDVVDFKQVITHPPGARSCSYELARERQGPVISLSPVAPSAPEDARDAARAVMADPSATARVKSAAYCVVEAWRSTRRLPSNAHWVFDPLQVTAENVCGTSYRLRNMHPVAIALQYGVPTVQGKGRITLAARPAGASFSEVTIGAPGSGTFTVYLDGLPIKTVPNTAGACP